MNAMTVKDQSLECWVLDGRIYNLNLAIAQLMLRAKELKAKKLKAKKRSFICQQIRHMEKRLARLLLLKTAFMRSKA